MTTLFTPALTAASICLFCPIQSTSAGHPFSLPPFQVKVGLAPCLRRSLKSAIFTRDLFWILGTAEVAMMTASAPAKAETRAGSASSEVTSTTAVAAPLAAKVFRAFSDLATATASNDSGLARRYSTASFPVRPPAPVTTILAFEPEAAAAMTETARALRQRGAATARLFSRTAAKAEEVGEKEENEEEEERDPLALERREAALARILGGRARSAGCVFGGEEEGKKEEEVLACGENEKKKKKNLLFLIQFLHRYLLPFSATIDPKLRRTCEARTRRRACMKSKKGFEKKESERAGGAFQWGVGESSTRQQLERRKTE